jgi:peptidyl-prolyl cis-trans isomerase A (cyclophilin A)
MRAIPVLLFALLLAACGKPEAPKAPEGPSEALLDPYAETEPAPATFRVRFQTTKGDVVVEFTREWAPHGVDRVHHLVRIGYFDDCALFRVLPGFVAQFGIHGEPDVSAVWTNARIEVDPVKVSNERGMVTFAMIGSIGPSSRTTQLFFNLKDNASLDKQGFAPVGKVVEGMEVVDKFHSGYGNDVDQRAMRSLGNRYLRRDFPEMDFIEKATIVSG